MSLYRNAVWYRKGIKEYTRDGFLISKKRFNPLDLDVDCTDKVFLITGANSGIGKAAAIEIARKAGIVHIVCRDEKKAENTRKEIVETTGNPHIHVHIVDLSNPRGILKFTKEFIESNKTLTVLINNAACILSERELTEDGLERIFSTNVLGPYILTTRLLTLLQRSSQPRVIMVVGGSMLMHRLNVDDLQFEKMEPFDGPMANAQSKRQLLIMTEQFAAKYQDVHFSSVNPGWVDTPGIIAAMPEFHSQLTDKLRSPEQGADTIVWLSVSEESVKQPSGLFFHDRRPVPSHLPLAWTKAYKTEDEKLMDELATHTEHFS